MFANRTMSSIRSITLDCGDHCLSGVFRFWRFTVQDNFGKFFVRGPGTSPPEMIGIVVSEPVDKVKGKLSEIDLTSLDVDETVLDLNGDLANSSKRLTEITCAVKRIRFVY